jgi:hypothetical protein
MRIQAICLADALAHSSAVVVVHSESFRWLVYGDRDTEIAVLGATGELAAECISFSRPKEFLRTGASEIQDLLKLIYRDRDPDGLRARVLAIYGGSLEPPRLEMPFGLHSVSERPLKGIGAQTFVFRSGASNCC